MNSGLPEWLREQIGRFEDLAGWSVVGWRGIEMALYGGDDDGSEPVFSDRRAPFQQFLWLQMDLLDRDPVLVATYQDDASWGLWITGPPPTWDGFDGIYRATTPSFPRGQIESVNVAMDEATLAEVSIVVDGRDLLFIAGETSPNWESGFDLLRFDESVLVFLDPSEADHQPWNPPPAFQRWDA